MKKLYTTILIIAVSLFISCDEQKAEDDIKKALDKTVDKTTPKPAITKPVVSATRVRVGTAATFSKVKGYSYKLKKVINGVRLEVSDENTGQVSSTQAASGVVIVATFDGNTEESEPIEFVDVALIKPVLSSKTVRVEYAVTFTKVAGYTYTLKNATSGVTLSDVEGDTTKKQVSSTEAARGVIIVATLDGNSIESDPIEFIFVYVASKAALQKEIRNTIQRDGATAKFNYIDTSDITDMSSLFQNNTTFNGDISKWNTSKVTDMEYMFSGATSFNQPLNAWDVSSVEKMEAMFRDATSFNQPLNAWDVSKVKDMYRMFQGATAFNKPLNNWTVSKVTDMRYMFSGATAFNKPLNNWDVSSVTKMRYMFNSATNFNQDLTAWVDKSGRGTYNMFSGATAMQKSYKPSWVE